MCKNTPQKGDEQPRVNWVRFKLGSPSSQCFDYYFQVSLFNYNGFKIKRMNDATDSIADQQSHMSDRDDIIG